MGDQEKLYISYNHVHQLCGEVAEVVKKYDIDYMVAIGGGGFIPARILRTFLKEPGVPKKKIFAIVLSLYEDTVAVSTEEELVGDKVKRIQWLDYGEEGINLVGKKVLIVDEVDDTRSTLHYALQELEQDADIQAKAQGLPKSTTEFFLFVLHNKNKPKKASLPDSIMDDKHYIAARETGDCWIAYPWETTDIVTHQKMAEKQGNDLI